MVKVRWTGAAGLELTCGDSVVLIDPYISRPGKLTLLFRGLVPAREKISAYIEGLGGRLESVIVSHTHMDHVLDIPEIASLYEGGLIGSRSLETLMAMHGQEGRATVWTKDAGISIFTGGDLSMIPSRHGKVVFGRVPYPGEIDCKTPLPMKARNYCHGQVFIPRIEMNSTVFMHVGSANFIESELQGKKCDVLFLCVPGWKRMPGYPEKIIDITTPEIVVPFHYDNFTMPFRSGKKMPHLPFTGLPEFIEILSRHKSGVKIMTPGLFEEMRL